ncbi:hypothetical protein SAMN05428976_104160 [Clostridium sp. USBA 49]|uniref:hypothetical protein n=1 Tax=Clostridium sp. USBA 49 TaxID=1881060 RepID=UPI00099A1050|nr:hypothetical protein [Clostridium sp. USBA 49]SKA81175.1 hypothetical protein SAMN05428976_104160 [Clostridium sp. USBA 49]
MSKKFYSVIVIFFTIIYTVATVYTNKDYLNEKYSINQINIFQNIKKINVQTILPKKSKNLNNNIKNTQTSEKEKIADSNEKNIKFSPLPKSVIRFKFDRAYKDEKELLDALKEENTTNLNNSLADNKLKESNKENNNKEINQNNNKENTEENLSVFNNSINKNNVLITDLDKEKILTVSKTLSPIDQSKIEEYINNADIINALNLLKQRLSDKEYENIKNIEEKYKKIKS